MDFPPPLRDWKAIKNANSRPTLQGRLLYWKGVLLLKGDVYGTLSALEHGLWKRISAFLKEYGVDPETYRCLEFIQKNGGCTASVTAQELEQDRAAINRRLTRLGERGFICKKPGRQDSRSNLLFTTPAGKAVVAGVQDIIGQWNQEIYTSLGEEVFQKLSHAANG